ncbi:MAG: alpha-galactosidase [Acidimicrobiia bacterium]|nr:alpha-galactosidase [Acidimicrobiia bacterium]
MRAAGDVVHLHDGETSVLVDCSTGAPTIVHWGVDLGPADGSLGALIDAARRPVTAGGLDAVAPLTLVPEHGSGFPGRPGWSGRRADGSAWSPRFVTTDVTAQERSVCVDAVDDTAQLGVRCEIELHHTGVLRARAVAVNRSDGRDYWLDDLCVALPAVAHATELLLLHGRWCRELHLQRAPFTVGTHLAENRRGRTSHEHPPLVWFGTAGFGEQFGEVWGAHLAWSGNARTVADRLADGRGYVQLGELLHPGEVVLAPGGRYETPWVVAVHATSGLTPAAHVYHRYVRAQSAHRTRPRPVVLNTWEAVYFDHDRDVLFRLAERAAGIGVERFVLDDGWFGGRRHDRAGLGDWWVSPEAHPDGLGPLIDHVRALGMDFGIWVEPEMVNPDSDLYRAHPEWALATDGYEPVLGRQQLVLDLARGEAFAEVAARLDALLSDHDIAFVKWDMNRDHTQASGADGRAGTHAQTLAVYRLLDELRGRHPSVEFESCASGGGRIDLAILERTERVWTSDCNDALERQTIQRAVSMLLPPEVMGAHVGPARAHTTGRTHTLSFRAATALFGHFGIEWNLLELDDDEQRELAAWVALYRELRPLLHGGDTVRFDHPDPAALVHGVVAPDRREALIAYVQLATAAALVPAPVRLPALDADTCYEISLLRTPGGAADRLNRDRLPIADGLEMTGRQLAAHGVQLPAVAPESVVLLRLLASSTKGRSPDGGAQ